MNARLAGAAVRRVAHPLVAVALLLAASAALLDGEASALVEAGGLLDDRLRAAAWSASAWSAFVVLAAPWIVLRAACARTRAEAEWAGVSGTSLARAEASRAAGVLAAALALAGGWSAFAALGPAVSGPLLGRAGQTQGPGSPIFAHDAPLAWSARAPDVSGLWARVGVSLSITPGSGGEVRLSAARGGQVLTGAAHVLPRGAVEVEIPPGPDPVRFELALPEPGARAFVTTGAVELWDAAPAWAARVRLAARAALALASWSLLAFGLAAWLRPATALALLAAVWLWLWARDGAPAWIPGASLFEDLASVANGRAPAALAWADAIGAAASVVLALLLARRPAEART
ncbi:MAG: hypothetical protein JNK02_06275 [Planctomycetes bacterium]|nr:hypothetical protein [Planctomycetota bacterium]